VHRARAHPEARKSASETRPGCSGGAAAVIPDRGWRRGGERTEGGWEEERVGKGSVEGRRIVDEG